MSKTKERPQEVINLQAGLLSIFKGLLPEAKTGDASQKERNFLSRAIAAFVLHKEAAISIPEAASKVVDAGGDGGIDAIYYNQFNSTLYLVQSKYFHTGEGIPELGDVTKFASGVRHLLTNDLGAFENNKPIQDRMAEILDFLNNPTLKVVVVLAYSGINLLAEDQARELKDLEAFFATDDSVLSWKPINLFSLHDWLTHQDQNQGVERVTLRIHVPGWFKQPHEMIYGKVSLRDIASLFRTYGDSLIAGNIRAFQGDTEVNKAIAETLATQPENFLYLNNGITAYCDRLEVPFPERTKVDVKEITAHCFSIVNGAQTLGAIAAASESCLDNGFVFLKLVSLEKIENDQAFAKLITTTTNFQNHVHQRDLAAVEPEQFAIAATLQPMGIIYHYKRVEGGWPRLTKSSFSSDEALVACACLSPVGDGMLLSSLIANPDSLWRNDDETEHRQSTYHRVFSPDHSARKIWRSVQAMRIVMEIGEDITVKAEELPRYCTSRYGRYLVLAILILLRHPEDGEDLFLSEEETQDIKEKTTLLFETLHTVIGNHYGKSVDALYWKKHDRAEEKVRTIFATPTGCRFCWAKILAWSHSEGKINFENRSKRK